MREFEEKWISNEGGGGECEEDTAAWRRFPGSGELFPKLNDWVGEDPTIRQQSNIPNDASDDLRAYERLVYSQQVMQRDGLKALASYLWEKLTRWRHRDTLRFRALHLPKEIRFKQPRRFLKLTEDEEATVDELLLSGKDATVATIDGVPLTRKLIACLRAGEWLNDEIVNAFMSLLNCRSAEMQHVPLSHQQIVHKFRPIKCYCWNTFFYPTLTGEGLDGLRGGYNYDRVRKWTTRKGVDLFSYDLVFIPLHLNKVHWALGCLDFKSRLIFYFDSLGSEGDREYYSCMKDYLKDEYFDKTNETMSDIDKWLWAGNNFACSVFSPVSIDETELGYASGLRLERSPSLPCPSSSAYQCPTIPLQTNGSDCGVFLCQYAEGLSLGRFPFDFRATDIANRRKLMALQLMRGAI